MERLTDGVRDVILYTSQIDKSKTRGYAFVEYESHRAAALARFVSSKTNYTCKFASFVKYMSMVEIEGRVRPTSSFHFEKNLHLFCEITRLK
jgi:hypothetical protein